MIQWAADRLAWWGGLTFMADIIATNLRHAWVVLRAWYGGA